MRERNRVVGLFDVKEWSETYDVKTGGDSLVQQHFQDEVDINTIMRRFGITRELPLGPATGVYGDFTGISDYESAVERVRGARERFMRLDPVVRERFRNDPGELIAAAEQLPEAEFQAMFAGEESPPRDQSAGASAPDVV